MMVWHVHTETLLGFIVIKWILSKIFFLPFEKQIIIFVFHIQNQELSVFTLQILMVSCIFCFFMV